MTFASSNRAALSIIEEVTMGVTPSNPTFKALRYKGESLNYNVSNIVSEEIRDDRNTSELIQVGADVSGDIDFELSFGPFNDLLEGVLASDWSTPVSIAAATDIAVVNGTPDQMTSSITNFVTAGLVAGQWVKVAGFSNAVNNGYHRLSAVAANALAFSQTTLTTEAAGASITITGTMLRNGTTMKSYTIQRYLKDIVKYFNFLGCAANTMSLDLKTNQILTGKMGFMGLSSTVSGSQTSGATITAAATNTPMNAVANVASIQQDYAAMTAKFNSLTVNVANNIRAQDAIGTLGHVGLSLGKIDVSGNIELYFEDSTMYDKYIAATAFSFSFRVVDAEGNAYIVTIPRAKFESSSVVAGGIDTDIMFSASWRGVYDSTSGCTIQIDKF